MTKLKFIALAAISVLLVGASARVDHLCRGFLPENDMRIPISVFQKGGLTEAEFNQVLDQLSSYYRPVMRSKGGTLVINRNWSDDTVNASAIRYGNQWVINMYGGLARFPKITADGFMLVACHEAGHHIGGAPKVGGWFNDWATNEGGSDYFASIRCMRFMFKPADNAQFVQNNTIDPVLRQACEETYNNQDDENLCMRIGMASHNVTAIFRELKKETNDVRFDTPDPSQVSRTDDDHPASQCRLDTYFQGALCNTDLNVELSDNDYHVGTCTALNSQVGLRPRCWFKPDEAP